VNTREDFIHRLVDITETTHLITAQNLYDKLKQTSLSFIDIDILPSAPLDTTRLPPLTENDLAELVFTSGTTGQPKGVMLSHRNIVFDAEASVEAVKINSQDRALSILPLSHMFELTIEMALIHAGASIVYARSLVPDTLFRLLATQSVTVMVLVPQALQLFLNGVEREVRKQNKEKLWEILHAIASRLPFKYRRYLFKMIHDRFGGHFRLFVCGGAYLPPQLGQRWENMGIRTLQGYGATECAPVISVNPPNDHTVASAGHPLEGVTVKINDDGEVMVQGPNVALGYWKDPEMTAQAFRDGWYYTGDLGYLDKRHNLYLKGRKKNMIVLANGMNVYPEDVENALHQQEEVKDSVVFGLNERNNGGPTVHAVLLLDDPNNARAIVQKANKQLASHQQIKSYTVWSEKDFPRTHTLKVKRQEVLEKLEQLRASQHA
jgi:long-chain acyl-CoA synthetase